MPTNQPYDPRYNAKLYIPKLTEEQRRARATPLERLYRPRLLRGAEVVAPTAQEVATPLPQALDAPAPEAAPASRYLPAASEVLCAEFPEIFAPRAGP